MSLVGSGGGATSSTGVRATLAWARGTVPVKVTPWPGPACLGSGAHCWQARGRPQHSDLRQPEGPGAAARPDRDSRTHPAAAAALEPELETQKPEGCRKPPARAAAAAG